MAKEADLMLVERMLCNGNVIGYNIKCKDGSSLGMLGLEETKFLAGQGRIVNATAYLGQNNIGVILRGVNVTLESLPARTLQALTVFDKVMLSGGVGYVVGTKGASASTREISSEELKSLIKQGRVTNAVITTNELGAESITVTGCGSKVADKPEIKKLIEGLNGLNETYKGQVKITTGTKATSDKDILIDVMVHELDDVNLGAKNKFEVDKLMSDTHIQIKAHANSNGEYTFCIRGKIYSKDGEVDEAYMQKLMTQAAKDKGNSEFYNMVCKGEVIVKQNSEDTIRVVKNFISDMYLQMFKEIVQASKAKKEEQKREKREARMGTLNKLFGIKR